jgi:quinate dehydrogenase (quinone)
LCTPHNNVIAVDADSGKKIWERDINAQAQVWNRCRGLAYFDATQPARPADRGRRDASPAASLPAAANCQRRLLMNTIDARLVAIDADTGAMCEGFGNGGFVDLKAGMGAPTIRLPAHFRADHCRNHRRGGRPRGGQRPDRHAGRRPARLRRHHGQMRWAFDPGHDDPNARLEPGQTYARSTPNSWAPMSYDPR